MRLECLAPPETRQRRLRERQRFAAERRCSVGERSQPQSVGATTVTALIVAIDESNSTTGAGLYVLAAVVVPQAAAGRMRQALRSLLLPRQRRLHWTKESQKRRLQILTLLSETNAEPFVYSHGRRGANMNRHADDPQPSSFATTALLRQR